MIPSTRAEVVSNGLSIVTIALSLATRPQFSTECFRRSNQQEMGQFGAKFEEEGVDRYVPNFNTIRKKHGAIVRIRNPADIFCRLSTMHESNRQTDRLGNGNIDRSRSNRLSATSPKTLVN